MERREESKKTVTAPAMICVLMAAAITLGGCAYAPPVGEYDRGYYYDYGYPSVVTAPTNPWYEENYGYDYYPYWW